MQPKLKRLFDTRIKTTIVFVGAALVTLAIARVAVGSLRFMRQTGITPGFAFRLLLNTGAPLRQTEGRTNILLLGVSGGQHAGADLTDTILVLSLDLSTHAMTMISVPRDLWSDTLKDKINSAYHYGEEKKTGGGFVLAKAVVEDIVGVPMHYVFMIDFSGFREIIDLVGGIQVSVPSAFTDPKFPVEGKEDDLCDGDPTVSCRYQSLHFDQGLQQMNGSRALSYVRSRHAEGDEGSDFSRARRQQDVLLAMKSKLVNPGVWASKNPVALYRALDEATATDMNIGELATVGKFLLRTQENRIKKVSLEPLVTSPPLWMYGTYVLVPTESLEAVHSFIQSALER